VLAALSVCGVPAGRPAGERMPSRTLQDTALVERQSQENASMESLLVHIDDLKMQLAQKDAELDAARKEIGILRKDKGSHGIDLPDTLLSFQPFMVRSDSAVEEASQACNDGPEGDGPETQLFKAVLSNDDTRIQQARDRLRQATARLTTATMQATSRMLNDSDALMLKCFDRICRDVISDGDACFRDIYVKIWELIESTQDEGVKKTQKVISFIPDSAHRFQQRTVDIVDLYEDAARAKQLFDPFLQNFETRLKEAGIHDAEVSNPLTLKKTSRVIEKCALDFSGTYGNHPEIRHFFKIGDIVRGLVACEKMSDIAVAIRELVDHPDIEIIRWKNRFARPSSGGWRDFLVCFFFRSDKQKHICEMQVAHTKMLKARQGLGGHAIYNCVRNGAEFIEFMTARDSADITVLIKKVFQPLLTGTGLDRYASLFFLSVSPRLPSSVLEYSN
jgi:hypothetical protein